MASVSSKSFESLTADNLDPRLTKPPSGQRVVTDGFDVLNFIDFKWDVVSTAELGGHFLVLPKTCQVRIFSDARSRISMQSSIFVCFLTVSSFTCV